MRNALPYLLILLAAVLGYWLLAPTNEEGYGADLQGDADDGAEGSGDPRTAPLEAPGIRGRDRPQPPKRRHPKIVDPRTIPRGRIDVLPVGPDLKPVPSRALRIFVEPTGRKDWARRLGHVDPETGVWSFKKTLAGEVEIHIFGDHVVETRQRAVVKADETTEVRVSVDLAGAIEYDVVLYDKTRPAKVTLALFDWQDQPVRAYYQVRTPRSSNTPRLARKRTQGPQGVVFGIPPGSYRLRAVSENEEWDDIEVDVAAGKTVPVTFELRR